MALIIKTNDPSGLLSAIKKAIDDKKIDTWSYDDDNDFSHVQQWQGKAWLRPKLNTGSLQFGILGQDNIPLTRVLYAVYNGRFSEMLVSHFPNLISEIIISPQPLKSVDVNLVLV